MKKLVDPEPFTIIAVVASVTGATFSAVNYWKTHHKDLPSATRTKVLRQLDELSEHLSHLRADLKVVEEIFARAEYPDGRGVRLGNGAIISHDDFVRYQRVSDNVFGRLKQVNRVTLRIEGLSLSLTSLDRKLSTQNIGDALAQIDTLLTSRDLSVEKAWKLLQSVIHYLESMVDDLRTQLVRSQ